MSQEYKRRILDLILSLRDSNNQEEYDKRKNELDGETIDMHVCPRGNKKYQLFSTYFNKNWHKEEKLIMWVKFHRKNINLGGCNNTNAVESMFRKIKHFEKVVFGKRIPTIAEFNPQLN